MSDIHSKSPGFEPSLGVCIKNSPTCFDSSGEVARYQQRMGKYWLWNLARVPGHGYIDEMLLKQQTSKLRKLWNIPFVYVPESNDWQVLCLLCISLYIYIEASSQVEIASVTCGTLCFCIAAAVACLFLASDMKDYYGHHAYMVVFWLKPMNIYKTVTSNIFLAVQCTIAWVNDVI